MDAGSIASVLVLISSAVGWWAARRLPNAANLERLRRVARVVLASAVATVITALAAVASDALGGEPRTGWAGPIRASVLAAPVLVVWLATIPRTWVLVRGRSSSDPLSWVNPTLRTEAWSAVFTVPLGASLVAAALVLLAPAAAVELPYGAGLVGLGLTLVGATALLDLAHRRRHARVVEPVEAPLAVRTSR